MTDFLIFGLVFAVSAATPGPDTLTVFGRGLSGGWRTALPFTLGVILAKLSLLTLVMLGLAALAETFARAFMVLKFAGAAYLVWAGVRLWRKPVDNEARALSAEVTWRDGLTGFALGVSNPHAIAFYVALLPTVVSVRDITLPNYLGFCTVLVALTFSIYLVYAGAASRLRAVLRSPRARKVSNRVAGGAVVGSGILVATR